MFKGVENDEIEELNKPMVRSRNAKEIVENVPGSEGNYKLEEYAVFTPEGYILILHRLRLNCSVVQDLGDVKIGGIPCRRGGLKPPVLLNHGAMMTSEAWLTAPTTRMFPDDGEVDIQKIPSTLPHVLLHTGYDVFIANRRGNKYSCKHTNISTHDPNFWSFSLDEPACKDLPAVIDYIRDLTGFNRVSLIGFSQGAAEILASLSMVTGLEMKVNIAVLLAPTTKPRGNPCYLMTDILIFLLLLF